jgi:hypothetical protein
MREKLKSAEKRNKEINLAMDQLIAFRAAYM